MASTWSYDKRKELELLLKEGYQPTKIADLMGMKNAGQIYYELKKVLSEEEYKNKQFIKYSAQRAEEEYMKKFRGES